MSNELGYIRLCTPKFIYECLLKCVFMTCYTLNAGESDNRSSCALLWYTSHLTQTTLYRGGGELNCVTPYMICGNAIGSGCVQIQRDVK